MQVQDDVVQSNNATQNATGTATGTAVAATVQSQGNVRAGRAGVSAASVAEARVDIDQTLNQSNNGNQTQKAGDGTVTQTSDIDENNTGDQTATATATATAGNVTVSNTGNVKAGGDGVVGSSIATAIVDIDQTSVQDNNIDQDQRAVDLGAVQNQTRTPSSGFGPPVVSGTATATAGNVSVSSVGDVEAGGNGVVGQSIATSIIDIDQSIIQDGQTQTTQLVGVDPATAGNVNIGIEGKVRAGGYGVVGTSLATASPLGIATSGDVDIAASDDVIAGKSGILAGSVAESPGGTTTQGNVNVRVNGGKVIGGKGFWGVEIIGGDAANELTNRGTITSRSGLAIKGGTGNETVDNVGTVIGIVDLGTGGPQAFNNFIGAQFLSGAIINLDGGTLTNSGTLSPGGRGNIVTSNLNGDLVQDGNGETVIDFNPQKNKSDRINVTGTADMDGTVDAVGKHLSVKPRTFTIISTQGGVTDSGLVLDDVTLPKSVAAGDVALELEFTPNEVLLQYQLLSVNFAPNGLNRNERAVGVNLNQNFNNGGFGNPLADVMDGLLAIAKFGPYAAALDQLSPQVYLNEMMATYLSDTAFTNDMMSCPVRDGSYVFVEEDQCVWAKVKFRDLDFDQTRQQVGFEEDGVSVSGGVQGALGQNWRLGFAAGYERADLETDTNQDGDGDRLHLGASAKYIQGPLLLAGAVTGGVAWYDRTRPMSFGTFSGTTKADNDIDYISGLFRAAYQIGQGAWYAKPMVDIDVTQVHLDGFTERGSGAALRVSGSDETIFSATPALELGHQSALASGTLVRTFVRGGVTFFGDDDFALRSNFVFSAPGVPSFVTTTEIGDVTGDISAGVTVLAPPGTMFRTNTSLTLGYDGRFGENFDEHALGAKANVKF